MGRRTQGEELQGRDRKAMVRAAAEAFLSPAIKAVAREYRISDEAARELLLKSLHEIDLD